ncbi:MAG TPA: hypothetical protein VJ951_07150 [Bacteroidales bacterium]|nr:hypothetical protein [Bacteroidales bacterium]
MLQRLLNKFKRKPGLVAKGIYENPKVSRIFAAKAKALIETGMRKLGNEASETREMAQSFFRLLEAKLDMHERKMPPTHEEVLEALEQLKDVGRLSVFTTAVILPGGAISLMGLEILARKYGINFTFVPSSFRKNAEWKHPDGHRRKTKSQIVKGRNVSDAREV